MALSANHIHKMETRFAPDAPVTDSVGTIGNPAGFRLQANATYARGPWLAALTFNFTSDYRDTTSHARVGSFTTVDMLLLTVQVVFGSREVRSQGAPPSRRRVIEQGDAAATLPPCDFEPCTGV